MDENEDNTTDNPSTFLNLNHGGGGGDGSISPLEQDVLDEYARLARNMKTVCSVLSCDAWFRSCILGGCLGYQ